MCAFDTGTPYHCFTPLEHPPRFGSFYVRAPAASRGITAAVPICRALAGSDFSYATKDGGKNSASFYGEAPKGGSFFRDAADAAKDTVKDVEGMFKVGIRQMPQGCLFSWITPSTSATMLFSLKVLMCGDS